MTLAQAGLIKIVSGTWDYWQAWAYLAAFSGSSLIITVYLAVKDPALLARRMRAGPNAETERTQQILQLPATFLFIALIAIPALDRRRHWSHLPDWLCLGGDGLIVLGFFLIFLVFRVNSFAASTVKVMEGQTTISTGPYGLVRHPMYSGAVVLLIGVPIALGSWWGLITIPPLVAVIVWRLLDEERLLIDKLPGYPEYRARVTHRLIPYLW
jgi:protein-S-isoprenylcysteine O-methyltransferase Ste14